MPSNPAERLQPLVNDFQEKVGFAIGTGRCGTKFLAKVIELETGISSVHERNPINETFHRYCKWYGLPVDSEGFLQTKAQEIRQDLEQHCFSFEASAHLSLSVQELYERFGAKFILLVRRPEQVVNSYLRKGWYERPIVRAASELAPGYQGYESFHHDLGRIMPSGEKFQQWQQMSRVGKIAWFWNDLNNKVLEQFDEIPETHWRVQKLENLSYQSYLDIAKFFGFQTTITQQTYEQLSQHPPNAKGRLPTVESWTDTEVAEFEAEVKPMAQYFGYEHQVSRLPKTQPRKSLTPVAPQNLSSSSIGLIDKIRCLKYKGKNLSIRISEMGKSLLLSNQKNN